MIKLNQKKLQYAVLQVWKIELLTKHKGSVRWRLKTQDLCFNIKQHAEKFTKNIEIDQIWNFPQQEFNIEEVNLVLT